MIPTDKVTIHNRIEGGNYKALQRITEKSKIVEFVIMTSDRCNRAEVVDTYKLPYDSPKELNDLAQEARETYPDHVVEAHVDLFIMSFSHTYNEELALDY